MTAAARAASAIAAALLSACIASNVVAPEHRLVVADAADVARLDWGPADANALEGWFESVDLHGDAAASLRKIFYVFQRDGTYTGAALADVDGRLAFQTLSGTWSVAPDGLVLDGAAPVRCEAAAGHVRVTDANGVVVLRRGPLP